MCDVEPAAQSEIDRHRSAAEAAEDATLWRDAVDAYEAALTSVARTPAAGGPEEAALLTALGRCYWNLSEARTAWRTLRRAISISQEHGDGVAQARAGGSPPHLATAGVPLHTEASQLAGHG